jgi:hypothetical protein
VATQQETRIRGEAQRHAFEASRLMHERQRQLNRPFVVLQARLSSYACVVSERTIWNASYGDLICAGETPAEAAHNFDKAWHGIEGDE